MDETNTTGSVEWQCAELGAILGLPGPVREEVLRAAVVDTNYAHNLMICRGNLELLGQLLADPPPAEEPTGAEAISRVTLARRAAESLVRWAGTGFSTVSDERYQQRLECCSECPHLQAPPESRKMLYALAGAQGTAKAICAKCGCVVTTKARRPSDTCPAPHPERSGLNRWGEPLRAANQ